MKKFSRYIFLVLIIITTATFYTYDTVESCSKSFLEASSVKSKLDEETEDSTLEEVNKDEEERPSSQVVDDEEEKNSPLHEKNNILEESINSIGSIINYPDINIINSSTSDSPNPVSGEYANILRASSDTSIKVVGSKSDTATLATFQDSESSGGQHYIELTNVGFYKGLTVNIRVNLESNPDNVGILTVFKTTTVGSADFLRIRVQGRDSNLGVRYDFIDNATGNKIDDYKGTWIVKRLNNYKTLKLNSDINFLTRMFAYDTSSIEYSTNDNFKTTGFIGTIGAIGADRKETQMMYSFNTINGSTTQNYLPEGNGNRNVYYDQDPITRMETPYPSIVGLVNLEYPKVSYKIIQDYPSQIKTSFYPNKYTMTVELDKIVDLSKIKYTIKDISGKDKTSYFKMNKLPDNSGVIFTIDSNVLISHPFVNNSYIITLESELDKSISASDYLQEDGYLHIPGSVSIETNLNKSPKSSNEALTKYEAPIENKAPEVNIKEPVANGELYKYDPEKNNGGLEISGEYRDVDSEQVSSFFQIDNNINEYIDSKPGSIEWNLVKKKYTAEEIQKILSDNKTHEFSIMVVDKEGLQNVSVIKIIWEKAENKLPEVKIGIPVVTGETYEYNPENEDLSEGMLKIIGNVRDLDSTSFTTYYQIDDGVPENLGSKSGGSEIYIDFIKEYKAKEIQEILFDNQPHLFTFYAEDSDGGVSKKASITIIWPYKGKLTFKSVPDVFFGKKSVSTVDKIFYVESKKDDLIIEDTRKEGTSWKVNAQIDQELTNQDTSKIIPHVIRYDDNFLSTDKKMIFNKSQSEQGIFNLSEKWITKNEGLNLFAKVGKFSTGSYSARIMWSLEETKSNVD